MSKDNKQTSNPARQNSFTEDQLTTTGDTLESALTEKPEDVPAKKPKKKVFKNSLNTKSAMLHTYKQDVEGLVKKRRVSLVNVMAMQMDKTGRQETKMRKDGSLVVNTLSTTKKKGSTTKFMIIASILMLVLGVTALAVARSAYQAQVQKTEQDKTRVLKGDTMIFVEHRARLNVTDRLPREILTELTKILVDSQATLGSITQVILEWSAWSDAAGAKTTFTITQADFIDLLGLDFSDQFIRLLGGPYEYMLGVHVADRNSPFILLTTRSHEHAFAEMLRWENAAEVQLSPLFNTNGDGSSKRTIEDIVVQNIDARAVRDGSRNLKLLYAFLDYDTILITNNIHTLTEVSRRYKVLKASGSADVPSGFIR